MFLAGETSEQYHLTLRTHLTRNMRLAITLSQLMVSGVGRALAPIALSLLPASLRWIADATRIPTEELVEPQQESLDARGSALS
jgi:hypothetical protein